MKNLKTGRHALALILLLPGMGAWAQSTWVGSGGNANWGTGANWNIAPADGNNLTFGSGFVSGTTLANDVLSSVGSLNFNASLPAGGISLSGNSLAITGGIVNNNVTSGRNVNLGIDLAVTGAQAWSSTDPNGILNVSGDLTGSDGITLTSNVASSSGAIPNWRFSGSNAGYMGTITVSGSNAGLTLENPAAMIGGNVNIGSANDLRVFVQGLGSGAGNTYTFGMGTGNGNVNFRDGGGTVGGLIALGSQDAYWRIGGGGNATFADRLELGSSASTSRPWILWGAAGDEISLNATREIRTSSAGNPLRVDYTLNGGGAYDLTVSGGGLTVLNGGAATGTVTGSTTITGGSLAVGNMDQIFNGNLNINGGVFVFNNLTWTAFTNDRTGGYGTGANQWQLTSGGFAARGIDVVVGPTGTTNSTFNKAFTLGSTVVDGSGVLYANASVDIQQDTLLTDRRTITLAATGPGLAGTSGVVHSFSGDFSDNAGAPNRGSLGFTVTGTTSDTAIGEIVLSGSNSLTGSQYRNDNNNYRFNTGPGGMGVVSDVIVRFDGQASLPTGNGGNLSWLAATRRNTTGGRYGYMLTGTALGETYDLSTNQKFLIGGELTGIFGSTGGVATLENSSVVLANKTNIAALSLNLLVRDGTLNLGSSGNGMAFETGFIGNSAADAGINGAADNVTDTTTATRTIIKRGEGTVALGAVAYRHAVAGSDNSSNFFWQIGRNSSNTLASPYFDGAVRETGNTSANSLAGFNIFLAGGVLESSDTAIGSAFTRALGSTTSQVRWGSGGGGFAAGGGDLTVSIGGGASMSWNGTNFVATNNPLMFGSQTADAVVTFQNGINLAGATREIRVYDNSGSGADKAVISGNLTNSSGTAGFDKTGTGRLDLEGNNTYNGTTTVRAGTLALTSGTNLGIQYVVNSGASFEHSGGTWVMGNSANNLFHVNGSGGTIQVADLANANDGTGVIRYTMDTGGVTTIQLTDGNPFAQYNPMDAALGRDAWAAEWTLDLNSISNLSEDFLPPVLNLMSSSAYNLTNLNNKLTLTAWTQLGAPTTYNNLANGQSVFINTGVAIAEYSVSFTDMGFDLYLEGSFAIPEPGTLSMVALALMLLRRQFRKRCLAA